MSAVSYDLPYVDLTKLFQVLNTRDVAKHGHVLHLFYFSYIVSEIPLCTTAKNRMILKTSRCAVAFVDSDRHNKIAKCSKFCLCCCFVVDKIILNFSGLIKINFQLNSSS